jgi:hypothetical protein
MSGDQVITVDTPGEGVIRFDTKEGRSYVITADERR